MNGYKIIKQIGQGGFGKVMLAFDETNNIDVAIKFIKITSNSKFTRD